MYHEMNPCLGSHYLSNIVNLCQFSLCQAGTACLKKKRAKWLAQVQDFIEAVWNLKGKQVDNNINLLLERGMAANYTLTLLYSLTA